MANVIVWITCRNYEQYLRECAESVYAQSGLEGFGLWSFVSHDDCGGDSPVGLAKNRNKALSELSDCSDEDYIVFLDADDKIPENYLAALTATGNGERVVVCCAAEMWGEQTGAITPRFPVTPETLIVGNTIHTSQLIPLSAFRVTGGYDETIPEPLQGWLDWDLWMRLARAGCEFRYTDQTRLLYRRHSDSMNFRGGGTVEEMRQRMRERYGL